MFRILTRFFARKSLRLDTTLSRRLIDSVENGHDSMMLVLFIAGERCALTERDLYFKTFLAPTWHFMLGGVNEIHLERYILLCLYNSCAVLLLVKVNADKALVLQIKRIVCAIV
jgi:hypothetical protein